METLFFIHIPKTAGTSFREAAIKKWGTRRILSDYGDSQHTSESIRTLIHQSRDYFALKEHLNKKQIKLLSGHAPVKFFRRIFPSRNIVTFLRQPVDRVISHYQTACRFQGYKESLLTFANDADYRNVQALYLEQMPIELIGFIGITEQYTDSLELFNYQYHHKLLELNLNTRRSESSAKTSTDAVDEAVRQEIWDLNERDIKLYESALTLFEERKIAHKAGVPFVGGRVQSLDMNSITGWATHSVAWKPVTLDIIVDGEVSATVQAKDYQAPLKERNAPREGYIGFSHSFAEPLPPAATVCCRPTGSTQQLRGPIHPRVAD